MPAVDNFRQANNKHTMLVGATFFAVIITSFSGFVIKNGDEKFKTALQFSVHAYQSNASRSISLTGPFMGKIRVAPDAASKTLGIDPALISRKLQASCANVSDVEVRGKCQVMRPAPMYLGIIHSAWSVLGAQSATALLKNIFFILLAFAVFSMSELWMRKGWFKDSHKIVRLVVVVAAVVCGVGVLWDFFSVDNMHELKANSSSKHAVGSATTGASVWVLCLLIICFSHVDDVVDVDGDKYGSFSEYYRRFETYMHLNINSSFLILLLLPLFVLLSLTAYGHPVVDVHVQLVFFSYIFFAVLDVLQTRVVSVLASLEDGNSLAPGIGMIKGFVVLAFVLCKFFTFFPTWQLMGLYYAPLDDSVPSTLHIFDIILVAGLSVFDLAYISGVIGRVLSYFYKPANREDDTPPTATEKPAFQEIETHAFCRDTVVGVYLFGSFVTIACLTADA